MFVIMLLVCVCVCVCVCVSGFSLGSYKGACWPPITPEYPLIYHFLHCFVLYWKMFLIKNSKYKDQA